jgi:hypothetical protein
MVPVQVTELEQAVVRWEEVDFLQALLEVLSFLLGDRDLLRF